MPLTLNLGSQMVHPLKNMSDLNYKRTTGIYLLFFFLFLFLTPSCTHINTHKESSSVSPDGWKCLRWQFSPATSVVRHHLSAKPVMEEKGRKRNFTLSHLPTLPSPSFSSLLCLSSHQTYTSCVLPQSYLSFSHLHLCFSFCCQFLSVHFGDLML